MAGTPNGGASVFIPAATGRITLELEMPSWDGFSTIGDPRSQRRAPVILLTR